MELIVNNVIYSKISNLAFYISFRVFYVTKSLMKMIIKELNCLEYIE